MVVSIEKRVGPGMALINTGMFCVMKCVGFLNETKTFVESVRGKPGAHLNDHAVLLTAAGRRGVSWTCLTSVRGVHSLELFY